MKQFKIFITILAIVSMSSCSQKEQKARIPQQFSAEQLRNNISVDAASFNKDDSKILFSDNRTGIFNTYLLNIADTTSQPLTTSTTNSIFPVDVLQGTDKFILTHDNGGDENDHLYLKNTGDTTLRDLTPWNNSKNFFIGWTSDKKAFYIGSNKRNPQYFDIWKLDTATYNPVLFYQNDSSLTASVISASERYIALTKQVTTDKNELYLYDRTNKSTKRISNDNEATWYAAAIEKNDSILYYSTNDNSEFSYLVKYNINTNKAEKYYEDKWDVDGFTLSSNEKYHTILVNDDGKNKVLMYDHATNKPIDFPEIKDGNIQKIIISPTEKNIILSVGSSTSPNNLFVFNIENKKLKQLTNTLNKSVNSNDLVKAEVVRFKSFDGKEIPAIFYKPLQADSKNKCGALVWVHGGPGGQSRVGFSNSIQYLVNRGYAVLAVNNRGSSGYGKTFYKLDNKQHGNGDLKDCVWGKKWLAEQDYIDSNAIGIYGGSYGGNVVLNALIMHPEEFKVGINLFGVTNWIRTLKSIPPYWEDFRKALYDEMGDPNTQDSVRLKEISPLYNYQKIRKPLIVFQGENDVRVLKVESDEIVEGAKQNGVPVEYHLYPAEGHGFIKKENLINTDEKTLAFLEKYLKPKGEKNKL